MKRIIKILLVFILVTSCENKKIKELKNKVLELEKLNNKLNDSLKGITYNRIISSQLFGISEKNSLELNKPNKFRFIFSSLQKMPKYNIYRVIKEGNKTSRTLIHEDYNESQFDYSFTPKNKTDNSFEIEALFSLDSVIVQIPGKIEMSSD